MSRVRALSDIVSRRGQTLAGLALSWALRDKRISSVLIGAYSVHQLEQNIAVVKDAEFTTEELASIDTYAVESGINLWAASSAM